MKASTPTKLTLRLDAALIDRAKSYAEAQDLDGRQRALVGRGPRDDGRPQKRDE